MRARGVPAVSGRPRRHGAAGERLVAAVQEELARDGLQPDVREAERLHLAADLADRLDQVRRTIQRDGPTVPTADGNGVKAHPLIASEREICTTIARLLDGISLEAAPIKSAAHERAARARWARRGY